MLPDPAVTKFSSAQGGNCEGPPLKDDGPSQLRGLLPGDEPQAGNGTWILFENNGASIGPQSGPTLAELLDSARSVDPAKQADPARLLDSAPTTKLKTSPTSQHRPGVSSKPSQGSAAVPSQPYDETSLHQLMTEATVPRPCLWSAGRGNNAPTYLLTRAGVAIVHPTSPMTLASGDLTERHCSRLDSASP